MKTLKLAFVFLFPAAVSFAAGFGIDVNDAKSVATAGTQAGAAQGASTVYYSPGAMAFEDGVSAEISGLMIVPSTSYQAPGGGPTTDSVQKGFFLPSLFATARVADNVTIGLGGFSNFGLGITWPANFPGRFDTLASSIQTYTINPSVAVKAGNWGLGLGVDVVRATVLLESAIALGDAEGQSSIGGGTWSVGFNAGISAKFLNDDLKLGLSWRSNVPLSFVGLAHFGVPEEFQSSLPDQQVSTTITLPNLFLLGGQYRITDHFRVSADLDYTGWSSVNAITLQFNSLPWETLQRNWWNTVSGSVAAECDLGNLITLRLGLGLDPTPSPSYTLSSSLPDSTREIVGAGVGFHSGAFLADLGYSFVYSNTRATTAPAFPGTYNTTANLVALTLGFHM